MMMQMVMQMHPLAWVASVGGLTFTSVAVYWAFKKYGKRR